MMSMSFQHEVTSKRSELNSTTNPLASGEIYTGEWEDIELYDSLILAVKTDRDGKAIIQFSPDAENVDSSLTRYYNTDQKEPPHRFTITRRYGRILFENTDTGDQSYLRLQTSLKTQAQNLNIPNDATMSQDYDAIAVRPSDIDSEIALGLRQGQTLWNKFGYNNDVSNAGTEIIAEFGDDNGSDSGPYADHPHMPELAWEFVDLPDSD